MWNTSRISSRKLQHVIIRRRLLRAKLAFMRINPHQTAAWCDATTGKYWVKVSYDALRKWHVCRACTRLQVSVVSIAFLVCFFIFTHIYIFITAPASSYAGFLYICLFDVVGICMHILLNKCFLCTIASNTCTGVCHACVSMALP